MQIRRKTKVKRTQQLEGNLDSKHRVQTEEASPKGLKFSLVFTGKSNSLNPLLGPQSQPGDQTQPQPCPPLLPRVQGREMVFQAVWLPWTKVPVAPGTHRWLCAPWGRQESARYLSSCLSLCGWASPSCSEETELMEAFGLSLCLEIP